MNGNSLVPRKPTPKTIATFPTRVPRINIIFSVVKLPFQNRKATLPFHHKSSYFGNVDNFLFWDFLPLNSNSFEQYMRYLLCILQNCHSSHILRKPYFGNLENYVKLPHDSMTLIDHVQPIMLPCPGNKPLFCPGTLLGLNQSKIRNTFFLQPNQAHIWWISMISCPLHFIPLDLSHLSHIWHTSFVMSRICLLCISKETTSYTNPFELKLGKVFTHPMEVPNIQK